MAMAEHYRAEQLRIGDLIVITRPNRERVVVRVQRVTRYPATARHAAAIGIGFEDDEATYSGAFRFDLDDLIEIR